MKVLVGLFLCFVWATGLLGEEQKGIQVTGEGRVTVVPDQIEFRVGAEFEGKNVQSIKERSDVLMRKLIADTKSFGIDPKDVTTENVFIRRIYREDVAEKHTFIADSEIRVLLRDVSKYDALVEKLFRTGANKMSDVTPGSTKIDSLRDQARVRAISDAKDKARKIADEFKVRLGKVRSVVESRPGGNFGWGHGSAKMQMDEAPAIALGGVDHAVTVEVIFEID